MINSEENKIINRIINKLDRDKDVNRCVLERTITGFKRDGMTQDNIKLYLNMLLSSVNSKNIKTLLNQN